MQFDFNNNIPIYIQLVEQLKMYIISGKIKVGERLPSVRDLAFQTKVNPNTMQKALMELENLGLIYTERTNGKYVTTNQKLIGKLRLEHVKKATNKYFEDMKQLGLSKDDVIKYLIDLGGDR